MLSVELLIFRASIHSTYCALVPVANHIYLQSPETVKLFFEQRTDGKASLTVIQ